MTIAIVGRTGSGKTFTAKGMIEAELAAGERVCIIDPTGAWWGLRLKADGLTPAFSIVIFGGDHADVRISPDQGDALGSWIASGRVRQAVVDVSEMTGGQTNRFLTAFMERLFASSDRQPLRLVLDEADIMAPQQRAGEDHRLLGATNKIVRRGRLKGFRPIMITQRPAVLDKSVLGQIDTLIAMRLPAPQDQKAIGDWIKSNADQGDAKKVLGTLASLSPGEGWYWAPHEGVLERRKFKPIITFDSSRAPEVGEATREVEPLALPDLDALRKAFSLPATEGGGASPGGEAALRAEITRLGAEMIEAEARGFTKGLRAAAALIRPWTLFYSPMATGGERELTVHDRSPIGQLIAGEIEALAASGQGAQSSVHLAPADAPMSAETATAIGDIVRATASKGRQRPDRPLAVHDATPAVRRAQGAPGVTSSGAARKLLAVLDTNPPVWRSWTQVATLAGLKARGGYFNAGRKELLESGMVKEGDGLIAITSPRQGAPTAVTDAAALVELWAGSLSGAAPKILRELFKLSGRSTRTEIAGRLGVQARGGHWNAAWKELRDNKIVVVRGDVAELTELFRPSTPGLERARSR